MATYREIHGKAVKSLSTDPSATTDAGQIWYNTASDTFKSILNLQAWNSAAPGIYSKNTAGGAGTTTAAVVYGGASSSGTVYHNETVEYDGSGFSVSGNLNTARQDGGSCGTQTAALFVGGEAPPGNVADTEEYNGTAWSEETNIPTSDRGWGSLGLQTAAVMVGGATAPTSKCFEYNGSSWTTGGSLADGRRLSGMGCGTETAGLVAGGDPNSNKTETYNGSSWTAGNTLNTGRQQGKMSGPQTAGLVWGGETPSLTTATEKFDGTSWTTTPATLGTAVKNNAGNKDTTSGASALNVYGNTPSDTSSAEEYNEGATAITVAAWAAGGTLNTARSAVGRSGIAPSQTAALCVSGYPGPPSTVDVKNVEEYNGTSWTEVGDVNSSRYRGMCAGTTSAGLFCGGNSDVTPGTKPLPLSEEWDGSSWTAGNTMQNGNEAAGGFGTQTAAVQAGGSLNPYPNYTNTTEEYNGTSWSDVPATIFASVAGVTGVGTETAGLIFCGTEAPPPATNYSTAQTYNGTAYTTVNSCVETGNGLVGGGTQTAAFGAGGGPGAKSRVQHYDGTTWSTSAALGTGRNNASGGAPQAAGIYFAGSPGSGSPGATEEFTGETTAVNVKTLTQS